MEIIWDFNGAFSESVDVIFHSRIRGSQCFDGICHLAMTFTVCELENGHRNVVSFPMKHDGIPK